MFALGLNVVFVGLPESVVPSSGTFHVKLQRKRGVELGITISGKTTLLICSGLVLTSRIWGSCSFNLVNIATYFGKNCPRR